MEYKEPGPSVTLENYSNFLLLKLSGEINDTMAEDYLKNTLPKIINFANDLVINCDFLVELKPVWIKYLQMTAAKLTEKNKKLRLILVPSDIHRLIQNDSSSRVLKICSNLRDALLQLGLVNPKSLDVGFINPFLDAIVHVMKISMQSVAKPGTVFLKKNPELSGDISGVIGLVSNSFTGNAIITFPESTFIKLMSTMHMETYTEISQENSDGAAEIANMIFGQAKTILNNQGYAIKTALPSIILGKSHRVASASQGPVVVVPFESTSGPFYFEIYLADNEALAPGA